ncbi:MAG TPA: YraN family protein [Chitinophagaceae bacterium]|nr:YraN family protein [Chitinophagaceae bacterium]
MALHHQLGKTGEQLAAAYLTGLGYTILHSNWRHYRYEIDLIASKNDILHFVEVKTRKSMRFGLPEEAVDSKKLRCLIQAGEAFLFKNPQWKRIQYDILSVSIVNGIPSYFLIEDVYL